MRRFLCLACAALAAVLAFSSALAQQELDAERAYQLLTDEHPRLAFRKSDLPALRQACAAGHQELYEALKARVDARLAADGDALNCEQTAFVYQVTGDARYAEAGRRKLMAEVARFVQWASRSSSWTRSATDRRRSLCLAADWLWEAMSPEERQSVARDFVAVARRWLQSDESWLQHAYMGGYNQWSNAFFCGALLAKSGVADADAEALFKEGFRQCWNGWMAARMQIARDDGGILSSYNYAVYNYLKMDIDFLMVMKNAAGLDLWDRDGALRYAVVWFAYGMHMPWRLPKIADSGDGRRDFDVTSCSFVLSVAAGVYKDPVAQYISRAVVTEQERLRNMYATLQIVMSDPDVPAALPDASFPRARHFEGLGWVCMRADWTPEATHAIFLCGDTAGNHQHCDAGSFLIYRGGELAADTRGRIYTTLSHNTFLLERGDAGEQRDARDGTGLNDGRLLPYPFPGRYDMGDIIAFETNERYTYVAADFARAYPEGRASELVRQFVWLVPDTFVIFDRVRTPPDVRAVWQLHCLEEPSLDGQRAVVTASPRTARGVTEQGGRLFVEAVWPDGAALAKDFQQLVGDEGTRDSIWRITVRAPAGAAEQPFLHVLHAADRDVAAGPAVRRLLRGERMGVAVEADGKLYEVLFNVRGPVGGAVSMMPDEFRSELTEQVQPQSGDGRTR